MKNTKKQQGFTLVTVMILSSIAGVVVLSSLKDNTNQERLSGNFQKGLNARLVAEQGVYNTLAAGTAFLANNPGIALPQFVNGVGVLNGNNALAGTTYTAQFVQNGAGQLTITSTGNRFESQAFITANVNLIAGAVNGPFQTAIVGCDGVNLAGSGGVNSYDSADGNYTEALSGNEGDVKTINHDGADVILGGNNIISGDVDATGNINTSSSRIEGNVHANGNVDVGPTGSGRVDGNITAGGNVAQGTSSLVDGNISANGDINLADQASLTGSIVGGGSFTQRSSGSIGVGGTVRVAGDVALTNFTSLIDSSNNSDINLQFGGTGTFNNRNSTEYINGTLAQNIDGLVVAPVASVITDDPDVEGYDAANPDTNCDFLAITNVINGIDNDPGALIALDNGANNGNANLTIEPAGVIGSADFISENANFLGQNTDVIKLDSLSLTSGGTVDIQGGNVTLFVENDFELAGSTQVTIAEGSSLTLIVKGQVSLGAGANIRALNQGVVEATGLPVVSIYSSFDGSDQGSNIGVSISGALSTYAAIYAPLTNAEIIQGTQLFGTVRAKDVNVTGNAQVHYDVALRDANGGGGNGGGGATLSLVSFEY